MSIALLFPGQGSQRPGMLADLPDGPAAGAARSEACEVLATLDGVPHDLDTDDALRTTTNAQLALLVAGVVTARALVEDRDLPVEAVAGHSVGAFAAAVVAGVLSLGNALRAVQVRGDEMERACADGSWGMAALRGLDVASAQALLDSVATGPDPLWIANVNAADQIVVSGTDTALDRLRRHAPGAGASGLTALDVAVASHCPIQAGTARAVAQVLGAVDHGEQRLAYFANLTGRRLVDAPGSVLDDLAGAVRHPVRWHDVVRLMPELDITATVQVPPGHVLTAIADRETPALTHVAVDDVGLAAASRRARSG